MLYTAVVNLLSVHLKLIQGAFETIQSRCIEKLQLKNIEFIEDPPNLSKEIHLEFVRYTKHLQNILKCVK